MGAGVAALHVAGPVAPWRDLGFTVADDGGCQVGQTLLRLGGAGEPGLTGWTLVGAQGDGPVDGIATERGPVPLADPPPEHPLGAVRVDHVVVMTPDVDRTFAALDASGMALRRERRAGTPERPLRQGFFRHSECIVEVVGPVEAAGDGPASLWGVTLVVADLDATAAMLGERLGRVRGAVQEGRRIATVRSQANIGVPVALISG